MTTLIEAHGIDVIPDGERHGHPRSLFAVWAAANISYLYIVLGGTLVLLGLNVWQALAVVAAGNAFWVLVGWLSVSGPASGTPSEVVTRAVFGIRGNRVYNALEGWGVGVAYEAINLAAASLAALALAQACGLEATTAVKWATILGTALIAATISVSGHAMIVRLSGWFTGVLAAGMVVLGYCVLRRAHWGYAPPRQAAPHGAALWAAAAVGLTIIASSPLSWGVGADFARYLPAGATKRAITGWTALGGLLPTALLAALGVLAGTVVDMTDPQASLRALLPGWFYPLFLLLIIAGSVTNNVLTAYSTGLALQAVGIPWKRPVTIIFDSTAAVAITAYALFVSDFIQALSDLLALTVTFLGPALAIYGVDIWLRRNRYDGRALHDETPGSQFWYWHGVSPAGAAAMIAGTAAAVMCVSTTVYCGPAAAALSGADLSALAGPALAAPVYYALASKRIGLTLACVHTPSELR
jgi:nucleobase:cation symporter-1, NCS1 family